MTVSTVLRTPFAENEPLTGAAAPHLESAGPTTSGVPQIVELILKDRGALHRLVFTTRHKTELATRLLGISLASFALYGVAMALACDAAGLWPHLTPTAKWLADPLADFMTYRVTTGSTRFFQSWLSGRAERIVIAYAFGLIAASGVCLPSLYFYGLLSGLRMPFPEVVLHTLKAKAVSAVALVGILPIYVAVILGAVVFPLERDVVKATLLVGLCLPFLAGLWGTRSLYVGFAQRCDLMPAEFRANRACFLRRLVLAWCGCYTAVAPVMIATVWQNLGG